MRLRDGGVESALVFAIRDIIERNGRSGEIIVGGGVREENRVKVRVCL